MYDGKYLSFNFHCLIHLYQDAFNQIQLQYENFLHTLKKLVRKGSSICIQIYNRLVYPIFVKYGINCYETISTPDYIFSIEVPNNIYLSYENKIFKIISINKNNDQPIFESSEVLNLS